MGAVLATPILQATAIRSYSGKSSGENCETIERHLFIFWEGLMARVGDRGECHPSASELESFLLGEMAPNQAAPVIAHLVRGCDDCREKMAPLASMVFTAGRATPEPGESQGDEYEFI